MAWTQQIDDQLLRDATSLALPVLLAYGRAIVLAALAIETANARGTHISGTAAELNYLLTGEGPLPVRSEPVLLARFNCRMRGVSHACGAGRHSRACREHW